MSKQLMADSSSDSTDFVGINLLFSPFSFHDVFMEEGLQQVIHACNATQRAKSTTELTAASQVLLDFQNAENNLPLCIHILGKIQWA